MKTLKTVLHVNAISSGITGIGLVIFSKTIASFFEVAQNGPFIAIGVFLVLFSAYVLSVGLSNQIDSVKVKAIIIADVAWVIASIITTVVLFNTISVIGIVAIEAVAVWVALMAYLQNSGLKKYTVV